MQLCRFISNIRFFLITRSFLNLSVCFISLYNRINSISDS